LPTVFGTVSTTGVVGVGLPLSLELLWQPLTAAKAAVSDAMAASRVVLILVMLHLNY
jgi:hypothetical protein